MKSLWPRELRNLISSPDFAEWYDRFLAAGKQLTVARARHRELSTQAGFAEWRADQTQAQGDEKVYAAGATEDAAQDAGTRVATIENDSFEALSAFETQRLRASATWLALGAAEQELEDERERASELSALVTAAARAGERHGEHSRLRSRVADAEERRAAGAAAVEQLRKQLETETAARDELWQKVEHAWSSSFEADMARAEHFYRAKKTRKESEHLFKKAEEERVRAVELRKEAQQASLSMEALAAESARLVAQACRELGCVSGGEFLFWPCAHDMSQAFCVPLIEERQHLNIQLRPLTICKINRASGLEHIEPVAEDADPCPGEDPRLDAFFARDGK